MKINPSTGEKILVNGVDRINNGDYDTSSVSCCSEVNYLKGNLKRWEFLSIIKEIYEHLRLENRRFRTYNLGIKKSLRGNK